MPTSFEISITMPGGGSLLVRVTRKHVKNLNLRVRGDCSVALSIPMRCPAGVAEDFLTRKTPWIARRIATQRTRVDERTEGACADIGCHRAADRNAPQTIPLWGEPTDTATALGLDEDALAHMSPERLKHLVSSLYKRETARALPAIAQRYQEEMGVRVTRWSIRAMKTRWGSCTPKTGAIRINALLAAYPPVCLDFVIAHELAHLLEPSHNTRFYGLLDRFCPQHRKAAALLRKERGYDPPTPWQTGF